MLTVTLGTYDCSTALISYLSTTKIAYEGIRAAAVVPGLERGTFILPGSHPPGIMKAWERIGTLVTASGLDIRRTHVRFQHTDTGDIRLDLTYDLQPFFRVFALSSFEVHAYGPYMASETAN